MLVKVGIVAGAALALMAGSASAETIKVDVINDELNADGDCSLREAVQSARLNNAVSGCKKGEGASRDSVVLKDETYTLSITSTNEGLNANGDLDVTGGGPLTVKGEGTADTIIGQVEDDRIFDVTSPSSDLKLQKVWLNGGDASTFVGFDPRGGNVRATNGKLTLTNAKLSSGDAFLGGALYTGGTAKATVKKTQFSGNNAGAATTDSGGGAIAHDGTKTLKIVSTAVQGSSVDTTGAGHDASGGGIYADGPMKIDRSLISGNGTSADEDNTAEHGGGIYHDSGDLTIVNSTIFNNNAGGPGDNDGDGGAIFNDDGDATVDNVTFDVNEATDDGDQIDALGGSLTLSYSIIAGEAPVDACAGTAVSSGGFNVADLDDPDCDYSNSDFAAADSTDLGDLGDNGGPTETISIAPTSVAEDFVPTGKCEDATGGVDQRGFKRPHGPKCDAGAFELGANKS